MTTSELSNYFKCNPVDFDRMYRLHSDFMLEDFNRILDQIREKHLLNYARLLDDLRENPENPENQRLEFLAIKYADVFTEYMHNIT